MKQRTAIFPGSFDPFTIGHLSIAERGIKLFDRLIIAIGINDHKQASLPEQQRIETISNAVRHLPGVEVIAYRGLTVDVCRQYDAEFILRGIRSVTDYEYEMNMADINRRISGIETVVLYTLPEYAYVSSSVVRELQRYGQDVGQFLP